MMPKLKDLILELSYTPLYHTTRTIRFAINILKQDHLKGYKVSLSRSQKFGQAVGPVRFVLNREKLIHNHKLVPYLYGKGYEGESEEYSTKSIKPLSKYLERIEIIKPVRTETYEMMKKLAKKVPVKFALGGRIEDDKWAWGLND